MKPEGKKRPPLEPTPEEHEANRRVSLGVIPNDNYPNVSYYNTLLSIVTKSNP